MGERQREMLAGVVDDAEIGFFALTISDRGNCSFCCVLRGIAHPPTEAPVAEARMMGRKMEGREVLAPPLLEKKKKRKKGNGKSVEKKLSSGAFHHLFSGLDLRFFSTSIFFAFTSPLSPFLFAVEPFTSKTGRL